MSPIDASFFSFVAQACCRPILFVLFYETFRLIFPLACRSGRDGPFLFDRQKGSKNLVKGCRLLPSFDSAPYPDKQRADGATVAGGALFGRKTRPLTIPSHTRVGVPLEGFLQGRGYICNSPLLQQTFFYQPGFLPGTGIVKGAGLRPSQTFPRPLFRRPLLYHIRRMVNWRGPLAPLASLFCILFGLRQKGWARRGPSDRLKER